MELLATPADNGGLDPPRPPSATGTVVAATALVLALPSPTDLATVSTWQIIVGVDEPTARRISGYGTQPLLAVTGKSP